MQFSDNIQSTGRKDDGLSDKLRMSIVLTIDKFAKSQIQENLLFSSKLSENDRSFIRYVAQSLGLTTLTLGNCETRLISVQNTIPLPFGLKFQLELSWQSRCTIIQLLKSNIFSSKESECLRQNVDKAFLLGSREEHQKCMTGRLMGAVPQIPGAPSNNSSNDPLKTSCNLRMASLKLPVRIQQTEIIDSITKNRIVIIAGPHGCGKSTQIPQMLLEDCHVTTNRCRVICTQPRRIAAHANADRVATERGETIGQSIGYQIRLESKVSPKTVLTFCTHGVLLRTIYADPTLLNATTHIIVDEIDEEDIFSRYLSSENRIKQLYITRDAGSHTCNLLLGILHRILPQYPHLKIILLVNLKQTSSIMMRNTKTKSCFSDIEFPMLVQKEKDPMTKELGIKVRTGAKQNEEEPLLLKKLPTVLCGADDSLQSTTSFLLAVQYTGVPVIWVSVIRKKPEIYFLEDILLWLEYNTCEMEAAKQLMIKDVSKSVNLHYWLTGVSLCVEDGPAENDAEKNNCNQFIKNQISIQEASNNSGKFNQQLAENMIWNIWEHLVLRKVSQQKTKDTLDTIPTTQHQSPVVQSDGEIQRYIQDLLQCIFVEWVSVDCRHSETGITPLMLFSAAGVLEIVERLLNIGANVFERIPLPKTALPSSIVTIGTDMAVSGTRTKYTSMVGANAYDLARLYGHAAVADLLKANMAAQSLNQSPDDWEGNLLRFGSWLWNPMTSLPSLLQIQSRPILEQKIKALNEPYSKGLTKQRLYQVSRNWTGTDAIINYELLARLILQIDALMTPGAILVFLPSYKSIMKLKDQLGSQSKSNQNIKRQRWIYVLHFRMLVADSKQVYAQPPTNVRKIILTTDIAENSMAIEDVSYVVDTGLVRRREFDSKTGTFTNQERWIGYKNAIQRQCSSRTGQEPKCFYFYSRLRLSSFEVTSDDMENNPPSLAMEELCLQAKLLTLPGMDLREYLMNIPRPPRTSAINRSVRMLRLIDAFDESDELTEFGAHMCDLPLPPRYSKMVLISIALKCVDPVLTIACILAYEDPFTIPTTAKERKEAIIIRKKFASDSLSDHMVLLRAFQFWQKARFEGWEQSFCRKNFVSAAVFEIVTTIRTQLLGQLRASGFVKARGSGDIRDLNTHSENWAVVKAALVAGMYTNLARIDSKSGDLLVCNASLDASSSKSSQSAHKVHTSPFSVLSSSCDGSQVYLKSIPSHWIVYDKLLGQYSGVQDERSRIPLDKDRQTEAITDEKRSFDVAKPPTHQKSVKYLKQKLLHCVTVISPFTAALIAGPIRSTIQCFPVIDNDAEENAPLQQNQPISMSDIESIFLKANIECGRDNPSETLSSTGMSAPSPFMRPLLGNDSDQLRAFPEDRYCHHSSGSGRIPSERKQRVSLNLDGPNGILQFECDFEVGRLLVDLRQKWNALLLKRLRNPGKQCPQHDEMVLLTIVAALSAEEQVLGLRQPSGVGARPRPMATELCNQNETSELVASSPEPTWADVSSMSNMYSDSNAISNLKQNQIESFKQVSEFQRQSLVSLLNCCAGGDSSYFSPVKDSERFQCQKMIPSLWSNSIANLQTRNTLTSNLNQENVASLNEMALTQTSSSRSLNKFDPSYFPEKDSRRAIQCEQNFFSSDSVPLDSNRTISQSWMCEFLNTTDNAKHENVTTQSRRNEPQRRAMVTYNNVGLTSTNVEYMAAHPAFFPPC